MQSPVILQETGSVHDETSSSGNKEDEDEDEEDVDDLKTLPHDPERLKAFNVSFIFVVYALGARSANAHFNYVVKTVYTFSLYITESGTGNLRCTSNGKFKSDSFKLSSSLLTVRHLCYSCIS